MFLDQLIKTKAEGTENPSESRWVSVAKAFSWRVVGTLDTLIISFLITGRMDLALTIGGIEIISKMILYYVHERAWARLTKRINARASRKYQRES
jgi:uncharacterized membrane protein